MAKDRQKMPIVQAAPASRPVVAPTPLGYDPKGEMQSVDVISSKENWSEYTLEDGTVLRSKAIIMEVKKAVGQLNADGEQIYIMQNAIMHQVRPAEKPKKKI